MKQLITFLVPNIKQTHDKTNTLIPFIIIGYIHSTCIHIHTPELIIRMIPISKPRKQGQKQQNNNKTITNRTDSLYLDAAPSCV